MVSCVACMFVLTKSEIINSVRHFVLATTFLFITSRIKIPMWPVPITLGVFGIYFISLISTPLQSFMSVFACYAALFCTGLLVPGGMTIGYVIGMLIAAPLIAILKCKLPKTKQINLILPCLLGGTVILASGTIWLRLFFDNNDVVHFGLLPFIIPDVLKIVLAVSCVKFYKKFTNKNSV